MLHLVNAFHGNIWTDQQMLLGMMTSVWTVKKKKKKKYFIYIYTGYIYISPFVLAFFCHVLLAIYL